MPTPIHPSFFPSTAWQFQPDNEGAAALLQDFLLHQNMVLLTLLHHMVLPQALEGKEIVLALHCVSDLQKKEGSSEILTPMTQTVRCLKTQMYLMASS